MERDSPQDFGIVETQQEQPKKQVFMDFNGIVNFAVDLQTVRDATTNYSKTLQSVFFPNIYTNRFVAIAETIDSLLDIVRDEVIARCKQLGVEEGYHHVKHVSPKEAYRKRQTVAMRRHRASKRVKKTTAKNEENNNGG